MNAIYVLRLTLLLFVLSQHLAAAVEEKLAPAFEAKNLGGQKFVFNPAALEKPTLIVFWATWCESCRNEIPVLKDLYKKNGRDVDIVAIDIDTDIDKAIQFVKQAEMEFPVVQDGKGKLSDLFGVTETPTFVVVDRQGKIRQTGNRVKYLLPKLLALGQEKSPPAPVKSKTSHTREAVLMGTSISIVVLSDEHEKAEQAIDAALAEMKRIEDLMTDWRESELMTINHMAGKKPVKVDPEILFLLEEAKRVHEITSGAYDITYASAGSLWNFNAPNPKPPRDADIKRRQRLVGIENLQIDKVRGTAFLKKRGMKIGLGGIAKGYSVDRAMDILGKSGFTDYGVNAGGDLAVRGRNNGRMWNIAIQDPRDKSKNFAVIPISNGAVASSGDSERFFIYKNKRYAHIIDPRTGYPAEQCQSVTILTKKAYWADALATGVFVLGPIEGMKVIEKLDGVEGVIVDGGEETHVSSGLSKANARWTPATPPRLIK